MSRRVLLATLFSSRGRPRASAAAPPSYSPLLLLPLLLVPALLLPVLAVIVAAGGGSPRAVSSGAPAAAALSRAPQALPPGFPAGFTPEVARWAPQIMRWSQEYALAPEVIATVMQIESCGAPSARSSAGAQGLFQVMPFHFAAGEQPTDPQVNAQRGLSYLARSMQLAGDDPAVGFAGYNGGHGVIGWRPGEWPAETQRYAQWTSGLLSDVRAGLIPSPTLQAWLSAGGDYLCRQAASATLPAGVSSASG